MKSPWSFVFALSLLLACNKTVVFDGANAYADGFETYASSKTLLDDSDEFWTFTQLTLEGNTITVDSTFAHTGQQSLRFDGAGTSGDILSKTSLSKSNLAFWEGESLRVTAWYYLADTLELAWLFLMDLEEKIPVGAGPGMRIALVDNQLLLEHKYLEPNLLQPEATAIEFPRNQWVEIQWELTLSRNGAGEVRLWQDGQLLIEATEHNTLPKDVLYFQQGTLGRYNSLEIGLTAQPANQPARLWVDEVKIELVE
ncbi:MAG: heparin lyase I family protein [Bacteroidota bacterium]